MAMNQLKSYFTAAQELKASTGILGDVLNVLHREHAQGVPITTDVTTLVTSMLDVTMQTLLELDRSSEIIVSMRPTPISILSCFVLKLRRRVIYFKKALI